MLQYLTELWRKNDQQTVDWIEQGLMSKSTHFSYFEDGEVTAASARIVAAVRAQCVRC